MSKAEFTVFISYAQFAVFSASLQQPFNDWTQKHVDQGFSWRPGSVSFRTLEESGECLVEIEIYNKPCEVRDDAIRSIEVPFEVPEDGKVEVGSISETVPLTLPAGLYSLRCELFSQNENGLFPIRLIFTHSLTPKFKVLRADSDLILDGDLLLDATPA